MKRVLITGGTGFIGRATCRVLQLYGLEAGIITRSRLSVSSGFIKIFEGNIKDIGPSLEEISAFNPDCVLHLAWTGIPDFSFQQSLDNLNYSINFFEQILTSCQIKKIVVAGSCWEAGKTRGAVSPKDWGPVDHFTWAKKSLFDWLTMKALNDKFLLHWARLYYVYGSQQRSNSLIPFLCKSIKKTYTLPDLKSGKDCLDYIHVEDVAEALTQLCVKACPSGVYNIGSGKITQVSEIADFLLNYAINNSAKMSEISEPDVPIENKAFWANIEDTTKLIKWTPKHDLQKSLKIIFDEII